MEKTIITFSADEQRLIKTGGIECYASNIVSYIEAHFDLGANWSGYDSVRAVWSNDNNMTAISTVLDSDGICVVPFEVLKTKGTVMVNLVGSISASDVLTDRLTTFPCEAVKVTAKAKIEGSETAPVTPSQFEQFVSIVQDAVANIKDIVSTTLNADYTLTFVYSDGTSYTTPSIRGERGPQGADGADGTDGNGIATAVLNSNYTLTLTFTDGTSYTTPSIRGAQGPKGDPGEVSQAQLDDAVSDLKSDIINNLNGIETFALHGQFAIGGLDASGALYPSQTTRVSSANLDKISFDRDIVVSVKTGFRWGYDAFVGGNVSWSGWKTAPTKIPAGTEFVVQISKDPEGTATANVAEYLAALTFDSRYEQSMDAIEQEVDSLHTALETNILTDNVQLTIEQGGISGGNNYDGDWTYKQSHYRSVSAQDIEAGKTYYVKTTGKIIFRVWYYNGVTYIGNSGDFANELTFDSSNGNKFRISFASTDNTAYSDYDIDVALTFTASKVLFNVPTYRAIGAITQTLLIDDNASQDFAAMQGMCFDGTYIWYYLSGLNVLKKYKVSDGSSISYSNLGLGHGNDLTYNPNTQKLYVAYCDGADPIVKIVDTTDMSVDSITLNDFDGNITSIAYSSALDKYVVVGGSSYNRSGNTDGWTRKKMIVYDSNFDVQKVLTLENDYCAVQGIECDDKYIYFCKSFINNGTHNDKVYVYDYYGHYINSFSTDTGEIESIAKVDDETFYLARCHSGYGGGYVYEGTVTSEANVSVLDVAYGTYQVN